MKDFLRDCFSTEWRWNRKRFMLYPIGFSLISILPIIVLTLTIGSTHDSEVANYMFIVILPIVLAINYVQIVSIIKRFRDLGHSGWFTLFTLIPFVNLGFYIYLLFFKWDEGENRFGPDPLISEENHTYDGVILK